MNVYFESKYLNLQEEVEAYRERLNITVKGSNIPKPICSFDELSLPGNFISANIKQ